MNRAGTFTIALTAASAVLALAPVQARAQSVNDFRLPSSSPTPNKRVQGPVDPDNPVVAAPRPTPAPSAAPTTPAPTSAAAPPPGSPSPSAPRATSRVGSAPQATTRGIAPPTATLPSSAASPPPPGFPSLGTGPAGTVPAPVPTPAAKEGAVWPWVIGLLALLGATLGGAVWWRRRQIERPPTIAFEAPVVPEPPLVEPEPAIAARQPAMAAKPPAPVEPQRGIALALVATRMNASLIATTLSYRLTLTNHTETALSGLAIEGDMVAAQAQVPAERQVAGAAQHLEQRHLLASLAPGESAEFSGDIRVPLAMISPIRAGAQALFIPLARFRVEAGADGRGRVAVTRTYVVGEEPEVAGAQLRPFRLDLGPRTYSRIGQRAVN